jgi:hypothetical protein
MGMFSGKKLGKEHDSQGIVKCKKCERLTLGQQPHQDFLAAGVVGKDRFCRNQDIAKFLVHELHRNV